MWSAEMSASGRMMVALDSAFSLSAAGGAGNGQAAKVCNNMILGITMIGISEAFTLADKLGLDRQKLFDISSKASGSCWAMLNHLPVPGIVETAAAPGRVDSPPMSTMR